MKYYNGRLHSGNEGSVRRRKGNTQCSGHQRGALSQKLDRLKYLEDCQPSTEEARYIWTSRHIPNTLTSFVDLKDSARISGNVEDQMFPSSIE